MDMNLLTIKRKIRLLRTTRQLFQFWNAACILHERGKINTYEFDEIQITICSQFKNLEAAKDRPQLNLDLAQTA